MEDNRLISQFMSGFNGWHFNLYNDGKWEIQAPDNFKEIIPFKSKPSQFFVTNFFKSDEVKFHSDWNWLMEVVEKIEKLGYWTEFRKQLGGVRFVIGDEKDFKNEKPPIVNVYKDFKIEAVYTACVKFIEWYNQKK